MLGGHFCMAPLGFIEKPGSSVLILIHHHLKEDDLGQLTNEWMDPSIGATKFYLAANVADFVSFPYTLPYFAPTPIHTIYPIFKSHTLFTWRASTILPYNIVSVDAMEAQGSMLPACKHPGPGGLALTTADDCVQQHAMTAPIHWLA